MRWQTTAVLAVILVALGAFYYVYEVRLGPEREKASERKGRLWTVEAADVTELELKRPDATLKLKREGPGGGGGGAGEGARRPRPRGRDADGAADRAGGSRDRRRPGGARRVRPRQ